MKEGVLANEVFFERLLTGSHRVLVDQIERKSHSDICQVRRYKGFLKRWTENRIIVCIPEYPAFRKETIMSLITNIVEKGSINIMAMAITKSQ
jgi:hypothetical protein